MHLFLDAFSLLIGVRAVAKVAYEDREAPRLRHGDSRSSSVVYLLRHKRRRLDGSRGICRCPPEEGLSDKAVYLVLARLVVNGFGVSLS